MLHVTKYYAPYVGGIERVVQDLARGHRPGFATRVLACRSRAGPTSHETVDGVPVTRTAVQAVAFGLPLSTSYYGWYRRLSREADLLHVHLPYPTADVAALLAGVRGRPVVVSYHSDVVRQAWALSAYGPVLRAFLRRVDRVLVASRALLERSPFLAGVRAKCELVPYGVATDGPEEPFPLPDGDFILFVGRLVGYKGVDVLLEAMRGLDVPLVIVGDGPRRGDLDQRARELGLGGRAMFLGELSAARLRHCYRRCRALALPSVTRSEAYGIVQLEAMAAGKPVVNTSLPTGVPEVSPHGVTGLTVPPGDPAALADALGSLLRDRDLHARLSENAERRAREHTLPRFLDEVARVYRDALR